MILQVLCLDECTANVDNQTAFLLQNTISAECKGMTVLTIAHRISTVMKMDNILVLDQGKLVSSDTRNLDRRFERSLQKIKRNMGINSEHTYNNNISQERNNHNSTNEDATFVESCC